MRAEAFRDFDLEIIRDLEMVMDWKENYENTDANRSQK